MSTSALAPRTQSQEQPVHAVSGWLMAFVTLTLFVLAILLFAAAVGSTKSHGGGGALFLVSGVCFMAAVVGSAGFFTLQPNGAAVLILFGAYQGTVRESGFFWT